jgi:hypothetical protein
MFDSRVMMKGDTFMATPTPQPRFMHAASFASLMLQVSEHLFPQQKLFELSQDQRRIVLNETQNLLVQARWAVESKGFAEQFATPLVGAEMAPAGTILGDPLPKSSGGHYA